MLAWLRGERSVFVRGEARAQRHAHRLRARRAQRLPRHRRVVAEEHGLHQPRRRGLPHQRHPGRDRRDQGGHQAGRHRPRRRPDPPLPPRRRRRCSPPRRSSRSPTSSTSSTASPGAPSRKNLFNWKDEEPGELREQGQALLRAARASCGCSRDWIIFCTQGRRTHEDRSCASTRRGPSRRSCSGSLDPAKRRGLVWHTQGSGKTFTMITVADQAPARDPAALREAHRAHAGGPQRTGEPALREPRRLRHQRVKVADSKRELARAARRRLSRGLIVSMIHKFDEMPANINTRDERLRAGGRGAPHHRRRPGQLPDGRPAERHLHRLHRHADRQDRAGKGTFKVFGIDDDAGLPRQVFHRASPSRTGRPCRCTTRWRRTSCAWTAETLEKEFLEPGRGRGRQRHRGAEHDPGAGGEL